MKKLQIDQFWEKNPALFYGLTLFLGCIFALQTPWALLPLCLLLYKRFFPTTILLFLFPCFVIYQLYTFPDSHADVEGILSIHSVKECDRFGKGWNYKGALKTEEGRILCQCFSKTYYPPNGLYQIKGRVSPLKGAVYRMKTTEPWVCVKNSFNFNIWRGHAQTYVKRYIERHICQTKAALFLTGMATGQLEDRLMMQAFGQLGLSHLMAISGLHFSLLALAFHLFFRLFMPHKAEALCLMILLTLYLLFIGYTPSILRAWIAVMVFLLGALLEKRPSALNSLGVSCCLSLLWNPLSATTLSFQLSFLATAGILFFYAPLSRLLCHWIPKVPLKVAADKHWIWQHGYILLSFFREAFALSLAVHLAITPLMLALTHTFSVNTILYNLFFPFLASAALLFFIVSIFLGHWAHVINGYYCEWILQIVESPPFLFRSFYVEQMPSWLVALLLTAMLTAAISYKVKKRADGFRVMDDPLFDHL